MKTIADLLVQGKYRRISIWNVLEWKKNQPDFWEKYKDNIFSINRNAENKVAMIFQTGRNGDYRKSYFRYKSDNYDRTGEGSEESYRHEFFKECFSRLQVINLRWKGQAVTIYVDEIFQEETLQFEDGSKRIVDLMVKFSRAEPMIYVEKWEGQIAIEIYDTHKVDDNKIHQIKKMNIAMFEFNTNKWNISDVFESQDEEEKQYDKIIQIFEGKNGGYICGELLVDSISRKYFSTLLYQEEKAKGEKLQKQLEKLQFNINEYLKNENRLKKQLNDMEVNNCLIRNNYDDRVNQLLQENKRLNDENYLIKQHVLYKLFIKKKI